MLSVEQGFEHIGARAKVTRVPRPQGPQAGSPVRVDIGRDAGGEVFLIDRLWNVRLGVSDAISRDRHLVLVAEQPGHGERFSRFLCGHDERAWFVAAIPEAHEVRSVDEAKDALKPDEVWAEIRAHDVPRDQWNLRWTAAFVRQGEWFFLPRPSMRVAFHQVLHNEPISRGGGQPHWCEAVFRIGGEPVYVHALFPNGLTYTEFMRLGRSERTRRGWTQRVRGAKVFAKGLVRHRDHATIRLPCWHEVVMNTETRSRAMEGLAFLD
jgi:hypothetical protein